MKNCSKCGEPIPIEEIQKYCSYCKKCRKIYHADYLEKNKEEVKKKRAKAYRLKKEMERNSIAVPTKPKYAPPPPPPAPKAILKKESRADFLYRVSGEIKLLEEERLECLKDFKKCEEITIKINNLRQIRT